MYKVNHKFVNVIRAFLPLGVAFLSGYVIESLAVVKNVSIPFLIIALVANFYYPELVIIEKKKLTLKRVLSKKYKDFPMENLEISVDKRGRYLILNLDHKYRLDVTTMSQRLYFQLKPYIKKVEQ